MQISLINNSKNAILYKINDGYLDTIPPLGTKEFYYDKVDSLILSLKCCVESYCQKRWFGKEYHLVMMSKYVLTNIDNVCEIFIIQKKEEIMNYLFKDFFLVNSIGCLCMKSNEIAIGADTLIKKYKQNMRFGTVWDIVTSAFIFAPTESFVISKIIEICLGKQFKLFYYIGIYFLMLAICSLIEYLMFHRSKKREFMNFKEAVLLHSKLLNHN